MIAFLASLRFLFRVVPQLENDKEFGYMLKKFYNYDLDNPDAESTS
jgi:hypothetical protein